MQPPKQTISSSLTAIAISHTNLFYDFFVQTVNFRIRTLTLIDPLTHYVIFPKSVFPTHTRPSLTSPSPLPLLSLFSPLHFPSPRTISPSRTQRPHSPPSATSLTSLPDFSGPFLYPKGKQTQPTYIRISPIYRRQPTTSLTSLPDFSGPPSGGPPLPLTSAPTHHDTSLPSFSRYQLN